METRSREALLSALREKIGAGGRPRETAPGFSCSLLAQPLPRGALTEWSGAAGSGKTELLARLLAEHRHLRAAWLEPVLTVYPPALVQNGVAIDRVLFVEAGDDLLWATRQVMRSQMFEVVVLGHVEVPVREIRRLQLLAEKNQTAVLFLRETPTVEGAWALAQQLQIHRERGRDAIAIRTMKGSASGRIAHTRGRAA